MNAEINDLSPAFDRIATSFYAHMKQVFALEGKIGHREHWQPLSDSYRIWKQERYPGAKILHLTGDLERSLTHKGAAHSILQKEPLSITIGTDLFYARKHQTGSIEGGYYLPQRKIIELTEDIKTEWTKILHEYIYSVAKKTWETLRREGKKIGI